MIIFFKGVVHTYHVLLLTHEKERNRVAGGNVGALKGPAAGTPGLFDNWSFFECSVLFVQVH